MHTAPRRGWIRRPVLDRRIELSRRAESTWSGRIGRSQKEPMDGPAGIRNPGVIPPGFTECLSLAGMGVLFFCRRGRLEAACSPLASSC